MAAASDRRVDEHSAMPTVSVIKMLIPQAAVMIRNFRREVQVFDISRIPFGNPWNNPAVPFGGCGLWGSSVSVRYGLRTAVVEPLFFRCFPGTTSGGR